MDFRALAEARYSVRKYADRAVEPEKLNAVLECARLAPSAVNFQPWRLVVVRDRALRQALHGCYDREWFATAPLYIVVCADEARSWKRRYDGKDHADIDAAIAAEHLCLAAAAEGLGSCWVCAFDPERCAEALELPAMVHPVAIVPIGYPADEPAPKKRRPLDELVEWR